MGKLDRVENYYFLNLLKKSTDFMPNLIHSVLPVIQRKYIYPK